MLSYLLQFSITMLSNSCYPLTEKKDRLEKDGTGSNMTIIWRKVAFKESIKIIRTHQNLSHKRKNIQLPHASSVLTIPLHHQSPSIGLLQFETQLFANFCVNYAFNHLLTWRLPSFSVFGLFLVGADNRSATLLGIFQHDLRHTDHEVSILGI